MNSTETKIKKLISEAAGLCYQVNATTSHGVRMNISGCTGSVEITFYPQKSDGLGSSHKWVKVFEEFMEIEGFDCHTPTDAFIIKLRNAITFLKAKLQEAQND